MQKGQLSPNLQHKVNTRVGSYHSELGSGLAEMPLHPHPLNDMRAIRTACAQTRGGRNAKDDLASLGSMPMSAKGSRDKYARLEQVRANLIKEARSAQGRIDDYLKAQQKRKQRMEKASKTRKADNDDVREERERRAEAARTRVDSEARMNYLEGVQKYKEQMAESRARAAQKLDADRARSAQVFVTN